MLMLRPFAPVSTCSGHKTCPRPRESGQNLCDDVLPCQDLANLDADADQLLLLLAGGVAQHGGG